LRRLDPAIAEIRPRAAPVFFFPIRHMPRIA
jgi:hypothetical protein